jgi:N-acetylglucosamine-6-phosphate deacetylase
MEYTQCSLKDAVQMATSNPAEMFSLNDIGKIEPGKRADLILFTMENHKMQIKKTFVSGQLVYSQD